MHCITPEFSAFIWKFDYAGIVSLISTSFFPVVFYCFQVHVATTPTTYLARWRSLL